MILRSWRGRTRTADADEYLAFLHSAVLPELAELGSPGAYILRRDHEGTAEFRVLSLWESMEAVQRFAGPDPERAVVLPQAARLLVDFDREVEHHEILHAPGLPIPPSSRREES